MAHFAELDENNVVLRVYVVHDEDTKNSDGQESEEVGQQFLTDIFGGRWVQTSYNSTFRSKFAGTGDIYDEERNAFISPSQYPSWILNEDTCYWEAPIAKPVEEDKIFVWDEESTSWVEFVPPTE